jgi:hypothetical protein
MIRPAFPAAAFFLLMTGCAAPMARSDWFPVAELAGAFEQIPAAYRGRWTPDGCADPGLPGLVTVYHQRVDTDDTMGQLWQIRPTGRDREMKLTTWHEDYDVHYMSEAVFSLSRDGKRLTIEGGGPPRRLKRCPKP